MNPTSSSPEPTWRLRLAHESDVPALEALIPLSVRSLQAPYYSPAQMEAALGTVFGVDRQLIRDRTYFVAENHGTIVGCGGWSYRRSLYGSDHGRAGEDGSLDPQGDAARVRAFFVHPAWARRGIGRSIMAPCEDAIIRAGFRRVDVVATLAGEPLYATFGYAVVERPERCFTFASCSDDEENGKRMSAWPEKARFSATQEEHPGARSPR